MNIWRKTIIIIGVIIACIFLGSMSMLLVLKSINIQPEDLQNMASLSLSTLESRILKLGFGLNHFISFIVSGVFLILLFSKMKPFQYTGIKGVFDLLLFLKLIILLILTYPIYGLIIGLLQQIDLPNWAKSMDETNLSALKQILQMDTPLDFLINFIIIAIFAGFGEEMIFRGVIQKELSKTFSPTNSIIIAALLFSALHFEFTGFLPKFIIGLILGYAYFLTQNLLYPILMHTFNNGFQLLILYLSGSNLEQADTAAITTTSIVGALLFIPLIYLMLIHLNKYRINGSNS